jgi:hypothetical protein
MVKHKLETINEVIEVSAFRALLAHQVTLDRQVPRKPRLVGGVKGHNQNENFLPGKPRPGGGELHKVDCAWGTMNNPIQEVMKNEICRNRI